MGQDGDSEAGARARADAEATADAQARLDQIRHQSGGFLYGREILSRMGEDPTKEEGAPPLDWRLTPRNVILQLLAVAAFVGAIWFMGALLFDSWRALLGW